MIIWNTDRECSSLIEYGTTGDYGLTKQDSALVTSHRIELTGLSSDRVYHYRVTSEDADNLSVSSEDRIFRTSCVHVTTTDIVAGEISQVEITGIDAIIEIVTTEDIAGAEITVSSSTNSQINKTLSVPGLNKFMKIEVSEELQNSLSSVMIKIGYTDEEVKDAGLDENSLAIYRYDEDSEEWVELNAGMDWVFSTGVNTEENYIWANVSHFSDYTVGEGTVTTTTTIPTTTITHTGGGGGGNKREGGAAAGGGAAPARIVPTCYDGIQNQGEEGIDCGGPCNPCLSCSDGIQNQGEEGIDCGGPCSPCPTTTTLMPTTTVIPTTTIPTTTTLPVTTTTLPAPPWVGRAIAFAGKNSPAIVGVVILLILLIGYPVYSRKR